MVSLAPPLNYLQERNTGFFPREICDAETDYVFSPSHDLVFELMPFKELVGCLR